MQDLSKLVLPNGWTLERPHGFGDQAILRAETVKGSATIDFTLRGFRWGSATSGSLVGDDYKKKTTRKKYEGRGWAQKLVDDVVLHMRGIES